MNTENEYSEQNQEETKKNKSNTGKGAIISLFVCVLLCIALSATNLIFNITQTLSSSKSDKAETAESDEKAGLYEDGMVIADEYTIRSTKHISDAYRASEESNLNEKDRETLKMASAVIDECITPDMTDYEKEKAIYDWMVKNIGFDEGVLSVIPITEANADTPYGVLKNKNAICVGYATTFRLFMEMLDINCRVVPNTDLYHSWNLVEIDGEWYHTDIYSANGENDYSHFNMSDSMVSEIWEKDEFPSANSIQYNYHYMNAIDCTDIYQIPMYLRKAFDDHTVNMSFRFPSDIVAKNIELAEQIILSIENTCVYEDIYCNYTMYHNWYESNGEYLLAVTLSEYNDEYYDEENTLSEEDEKLILDSLENAFGDVIDIENFAIGYDEYYDEEYYDEEYYKDEYYKDECYDEEYYE